MLKDRLVTRRAYRLSPTSGRGSAAAWAGRGAALARGCEDWGWMDRLRRGFWVNLPWASPVFFLVVRRRGRLSAKRLEFIFAGGRPGLAVAYPRRFSPRQRSLQRVSSMVVWIPARAKAPVVFAALIGPAKAVPLLQNLGRDVATLVPLQTPAGAKAQLILRAFRHPSTTLRAG